MRGQVGPPQSPPGGSGVPSLQPHPAPPHQLCVQVSYTGLGQPSFNSVPKIPTTHMMEAWEEDKGKGAGRRNLRPRRESNTLDSVCSCTVGRRAGEEVVTVSLSFDSKLGFSPHFLAHVAPWLGRWTSPGVMASVEQSQDPSSPKMVALVPSWASTACRPGLTPWAPEMQPHMVCSSWTRLSVLGCRVSTSWKILGK